MVLNNTECDLDELILRHGANKTEAARELRRLTGLTLKEAKNALEDYEKGKPLSSIIVKPGIFQRIKKTSPFATFQRTCHNKKT